jgi:hypothetical protein
VEGLHYFVKHQVAEVEAVDERYCQVVDAHYFRGRFSAQEAQEANKLFDDRAFDEVLMRAGVITHYLPRSPRGEKGIDVWLALEAFELAVYKRFNILTLVACDGDYLPLIRKINTLGTRVMLLAWDFDQTDRTGRRHQTRTAQVLLDEVTYPILMHNLIDDRSRRKDPVTDALFCQPPEDERPPAATSPAATSPAATSPAATTPAATTHSAPDGDERSGSVKYIPPGGERYGFILDDEPQTDDWFFPGSHVVSGTFDDFAVGDRVRFKLGNNPRGGFWAIDVEKLD